METPYRKVKNGKVTDEIDYLSAIEEGQYRDCAGKCGVGSQRQILPMTLVSSRHKNEFTLATPDRMRIHGRGACPNRIGCGFVDSISGA